MNAVKGRHIVIAVSGGIAAYKSAMLASALSKAGADVHVCMTKNACEFIAPITFETLTKNAVVTDTFDRSRPYEVGHIALAQLAEAVIVAPATANVIAKAAAGIADDFVTTLLLAAECPVVFAPAMNTAMYINPVTQRNIAALKALGKRFIDPGEGLLACGDTGAGRMAEPESIAEYIDGLFKNSADLSGKRILVTAGPTVERIDDVRFISNRSSGKMGYAIACAARDRGAEVTLVSGPVSLEPPTGINVIKVESAAQMFDAVTGAAEENDIIIKAAAVADYTPETKTDGKIKKSGDMSLKLVRTRDILLELGQNKGGRVLVGFAAEAADLLENAEGKLKKKNVDMICANDISKSEIGFGSDENAITLLFKDGRRETIEKCTKREAADRILDAILTIR